MQNSCTLYIFIHLYLIILQTLASRLKCDFIFHLCRKISSTVQLDQKYNCSFFTVGIWTKRWQYLKHLSTCAGKHVWRSSNSIITDQRPFPSPNPRQIIVASLWHWQLEGWEFCGTKVKPPSNKNLSFNDIADLQNPKAAPSSRNKDCFPVISNV